MTTIPNPNPGPNPDSRAARPAIALAAVWTGALIVLAALWIRSPFTGPGPMFLAWSALAFPLSVWSWARFRRWNVRQTPRGAGALVGLGTVWILVAATSLSLRPALWALDGLILRQPALRAVGMGLQWLPGVFGLTLSVAGLAFALEARYRLARGQAGSAGTPD